MDYLKILKNLPQIMTNVYTTFLVEPYGIIYCIIKQTNFGNYIHIGFNSESENVFFSSFFCKYSIG